MTCAVLAILVLSGSLLPARAQPELARPLSSYTKPAYLGGSISANVSIQNLASISAKLRQVQLEFDWNKTYTGPLEILEPGKSYTWEFPTCAIPEHTWPGNHSFVFSFFLSWAEPTGNWSSEKKLSVLTYFPVEPALQSPKPLEIFYGFLRSPPGISAFLLVIALVLVVAVISGKRLPGRKISPRVAIFLLSAIGFVVLWYLFGKGLDSWEQSIPPAAIMWAFQFSSIFVIALVSVGFVRVHKRLWSESYGRAVDIVRPLSPRAIGLSCFMLNFTLFTLEFLLPFREVLVAFVPFLEPAARLFPPFFTASPFLRTYKGASALVVLPGPALLFAVRALRRWTPQTGRTILEILQVVFYASALLAFYSWSSGGTLSGELLQDYGTVFVLFLLPGSLIIPLVTWLLEKMVGSGWFDWLVGRLW